MNLTFESRFVATARSNVKFENSTRIIYLLVVLMILTFASTVVRDGMQMSESDHEIADAGFLAAGQFAGDLGEIRTPDPLLRTEPLYPAELRGH
jgi:hypothetical protein